MAQRKRSSFWSELRRRHVVRALSFYAVAAWVVVQVADVFFPALLLPDWSVTVVAVMAIAGFPLTAVVAWLYDWKAGGLSRTDPQDAGSPEDAAEDSARARDGSGDRPVVAVLPFETVGDANPTLTEGLHGDVLTGLSAVEGLDVISRSSVLRYGDPDTPVAEIRDALGAGWMLRGEVQQVGDEVRVHARLVDIHRDRQVWANAFQRELTASGLFAIQDEITGRIVRATKARLGVRERAPEDGAGTDDLDAYRLYVQGRGLLGPRTEPSMRRALGVFQRAVELDPDYAAAWAGMADALTYLQTFGYPLPDASVAPGEAARRALELDADLAEAHFALANLAHAGRRNPEALERAARSVELRPSYADAHNLMSWIHNLDGRPDLSILRAGRASELDPLGAAPLSNLAIGQLIRSEFDAALGTARRVQSVAPDYTTGPFLQALVLYHQGRFQEVDPLVEGLTVPWADEAPGALLALARIARENAGAPEGPPGDVDLQGDDFSQALVRLAQGARAQALERLAGIQSWSYWGTLAMRYFFPELLDPVRESAAWTPILARIRASWGNPAEEGAGAEPTWSG